MSDFETKTREREDATESEIAWARLADRLCPLDKVRPDLVLMHWKDYESLQRILWGMSTYGDYLPKGILIYCSSQAIQGTAILKRGGKALREVNLWN